MGLLMREERSKLVNLLLEITAHYGSGARDQLLIGFPPRMVAGIPVERIPRAQVVSILDVVDGPAAQRADKSWPIVWLVENAIELAWESVQAPELERLLDTLQARAGAAKAGESLEGLVNRASKIANPQVWVDRMAESMLAVCRVVTPQMKGTGFLIGPDVVMTNYHVVQDVLGRPEQLRKVRLDFDYRTDSQDRPLKKEDRKTYMLREGQQMPFSVFNDLDYALLAVDGRPGDDQVATRFGTVRRGWLVPSGQAIKPDQMLFILQHPLGDYLGVAVDRVTNVMEKRIQYQTNTNAGSSGSPCFNEDWALVALHHAGENQAQPTWNQGVPFSALLGRQELRDAVAQAAVDGAGG